MRVVSQKTPAPRLLNCVVPEVPERPSEPASVKSKLTGTSLFSGNGRAIFIGIFLGAVVLSTISGVYVHRQAIRSRAENERKLLAVSTHSISASESIVVKITADQIHVSAISLGHPKLAIINGRQVSEGEQIALHIPAASVAVSLRVVNISDGQIELSDGTQLITARLELAAPPKVKP
jgi:archaellum component FlaF (FlaF/FlaG flagellin family)